MVQISKSLLQVLLHSFLLLLTNSIYSQTHYIDVHLSQECLELNSPAFSEQQIRIFPNPSDGVLRIQAEEPGTGNFEIKVQSLSGQVIFTRLINRAGNFIDEQFDLSGHPRGIYILNLITSESLYKYKIVIE